MFFLEMFPSGVGPSGRKPNPDPLPLLGPFLAPPYRTQALDHTQALARLSGLGWLEKGS